MQKRYRFSVMKQKMIILNKKNDEVDNDKNYKILII